MNKVPDGFYITTPIYYANGTPHLGHAFTTLLADTLGRYHRLFQGPVKYTTGTDEHGQKVQEVAASNGVTPLQQADRISAVFRDSWKELGICYDDFIRTTEQRHKDVVRQLVTKLMDSGDIYKGIYRGWYMVEDEDFYPDTRVREISEDPENDPRLQRVEEENYFFRLSHYTEPLLRHYASNRDFVLPRNRRSEMLAMLEEGLDDISVSRASVQWGIPIPGDSEQVIYVWVEALMNYLTSSGIFQNEEEYQTFWPAACQVVGKDILKFHAVIWPALLLALKLPLPKTILAHGWILSGGEKMSKSKGNTQDPLTISRTYGNDAFRFTLLREVSIGQDSQYDSDTLIKRYNAELANDLGNLVQRTLGFAKKRLSDTLSQPAGYNADWTFIPQGRESSEGSIYGLKTFLEALDEYRRHMEKFEIQQGLERLWSIVRDLNRFVDQAKPWVLAKDSIQDFEAFIYFISDLLVRFAHAASPFLPNTAAKILEIFDLKRDFQWDHTLNSALSTGFKLNDFEPLFPKIQVAKTTPIEQKSKSKETKITIDDFSKMKLEVVTVLESKVHPDAQKLLVLQLSTSQGRKQVVSGIAQFYQPEELIGKKVVLLRNLEPTEIRGIRSEGMILAGSNKKELSLMTVDKPIQEGSKVS